MKPYTLIIIGTGQHHQGHSLGNPDKDADHQLKALVQRLQQSGQNITAAAFIVDGKPEMIIGNAADLSFDTDAAGGVTLETVNEKIDLMMKGQNDLADLIEAATNEEEGAVTPATVNANVEQVIKLLTQDKQPAPEPKPARASKKKAGGAEDKPVPEGKPEVELLQDDPDGKSAQGDGAGSSAADTNAAEGGDAADGQAGHEQETAAASETTAQTEGAEG